MRFVKWGLVLWLAISGAALADGIEHGLFVTGTGRVAAEPDMATLALGVTTAAPSASDAMRANSAAVADILARLDALGVAGKDRQTSRFYLRPIWSDRTQPAEGAARITGYEAGNSVSVRVRDLTRLGDILDAVVALGGNEFNGLTFGLQDDAQARSAARKAAVADAMARAAELAEAAGLQLGAVRRLTEGDDSAGPHMMESFARSSAVGDAVASGEVEVTAVVSMVFEIAPLQ